MPNLTDVINNAYNHLRALESQIEEGVQTFNNENLISIIKMLKTDSNLIAQKMHEKQKIAESVKPIDAKLIKDVMTLLFQIQHHGDFDQALGALQSQLRQILKRIEANISNWIQKVERTQEMGPHK